METHTLILLLLVGMLGIFHEVTAKNDTNINPVTQEDALKANERFRRLIPYMTFYFAQQNYGNRPQYQELSGAAPVAPVSSNKLSNIPQYRGNLVVPATYLLRYTPKQTSQQQQPQPQPERLIPRPFSPSNTEDVSAQTYTEPPQTYRTQSVEYVHPRVVQDNNYDSARAMTISQIIRILQAIRKLPQRVTPENREQTMAQLIDILQQTNQLPASTVNSLSKILSRIPQLNKIYQSLSAPALQTPQPAPVNTRPKYIIYTNTNNPSITKSIVQSYTNPNYINKVSQISTTVPNQVQNIDEYDNYEDEPRTQPPVTRLKPQVLSRPLPLPIPHVSTVAPNTNELPNYDYSSEVLDAPEITKKPLLPTTISQPSSTPKPVDDDLRTYSYAAKIPQPNLYRGSTTTQIFPAPIVDGGTPGRPGIDYPTHSTIPETSFSCKNQRYKGFFGDPDTSCQVWHYCDLNGGQASFLCPNGTIFSQVGLTCDWWFNVRCASTAQLYVLNERLYKYILPVQPSFPEDFSGPLVDQYLTRKFEELENKKKKNKENANKTEDVKPSKP